MNERSVVDPCKRWHHFAMLEATLPMAMSLKWVSYACRMAGAARPRWSREHATWTTTIRGASGELETLTLRAPAPNMVRIDADSDAAHRIVTSLFTGMRWAERQRRAA